MKKGITPIGVSSLIVIFAVLCLAVFAVLSVATVESDRRLGDSAQKAVTDYYAAQQEAEEILARLRQGEKIAQEEDGIYTYRCRISDNQVLEVAVKISGESYEVLRWQAVSTAPWQPEETLDLWKGDTQ